MVTLAMLIFQGRAMCDISCVRELHCAKTVLDVNLSCMAIMGLKYDKSLSLV